MSVVVSSSTVVSPLWGTAEATSAPTAIPVHDEGVFLSFQLAGDPCSAIADAVTFVAFHPVDETCFVFGTASGRAYGVSLQDNKVFLLADVGTSAIRCGVFCPGYLTSPIVALVTSKNRLAFVDWQRGMVVQETAMTAHTQPILRLVTGPSTESLFCAVSADAFSCWEAVAERVGMPNPNEQHAAVCAQGPQPKAHAFDAAAAPMKGSRKAEATFYSCTGSAVPTHRTLGRLHEPALVPGQLPCRTAAHIIGVHVIDPSLLLSVESNNVLSLWTRRVDLSGMSVVPGPPSDSSHITDGAGGGSAAHSESPLQLRESVVAPSTLRLRCSAMCGRLIALGADAAATSTQGPVVKPVVAFVDAQTLAGTGVVLLPSNSYSGGTSASRSAGQTAATVVQVSALQSDLVACLLSTGVMHVVLSGTYHLVFSIQPPSAFPGSSALLRASSASSTLLTRAWWSMTPSGPTFSAMYRNQTLVLLHLPTARKESVYGSTSAASEAVSPTRRRSDVAVQHRRRNPVKNGKNNDNRAIQLPPALPPQNALNTSPLALAEPFLRHRPPSRSSRSTSARDYNRAECPSSTLQRGGRGEAVEELDAAMKALAMCRPPPVVPKKGFSSKWVDVNLIDVHISDTEGVQRADEATHNSNEGSSTSFAARSASEQKMCFEPSFCDTLPVVSCQYNLEHLRAHLIKYGVFPHAYRPFIWRFLVALPSKTKTASCFAAVARRPLHVAVEQLMKPFPLPHSKTRQAIEEALSCLCWASPVLTLASYLPVLVYPLVMLYRSDVQTVVELTLMFFENWGREFFVCHPCGPISVLAAMERELRRLDAALSQHLSAVGAGVEVWGWELLTSFYTDVLTGPEWLQVMDHAFASSPMWLFAFHVTLVSSRLRASLMAAVSTNEVRRVLSHPAGANTSNAASALPTLKDVLEDAYRLHGEWVKNNEGGPHTELSSYAQLHTMSHRFEYSDALMHNPAALAEKMRELALVQRSRYEETEAAERYAALRKEAEAAATKESMFLQQQRASVAAKYDASAAAWRVQVALERTRQELEAQERQLRWNVLQQRTRNAEELQALTTEMHTIESQLRHDMVDRHMEQLKWSIGAHIADDELSRLQHAAEERVERAMRHVKDAAETEAMELARFHAEPALKFETDSLAKSAGADCMANTSVDAEKSSESRTSRLQSGQEIRALASTEGEEEIEKRSSHEICVDPLLREDASEGSGSGNYTKGKENALSCATIDAPNPHLSHRLSPPSVVAQTARTTTNSSSLLTQETGHIESLRVARASTALDKAGVEPAGNSTAILSTATGSYASPLKGARLPCQRCAQQSSRRPGAPAPRHRSYTTSTSSGHYGSSCATTDPNTQSFVELRNRVLRRLQPRNYANTIANQPMIPKGRQRPPSRSSSGTRGPTTTTHTPSFTSTSYYTSYTYGSRTSTSTMETTTCPSTKSTVSSSGHHLFRDLPCREPPTATRSDYSDSGP
ncbi:hypothetical protein ABL78_1882 [Leptomonas seymouri]|uniref:Rab-GAP TBC domain-containing protein n=1 Tax=Leptomonas seymouri TaxID=5684 RepID=A0A0N1PEI7_LEPSE|nr:hypothetical protein ABL78_1882 [Leptomonas seymouri]|eukprot:KPI88998.1 hypothetical protein ABL78_1882 [Leptomonas seymouri]